MATQEQIAEAMNAMQRQIAELAGQLAEERHRGASLDREAQVLDRWTTQQAQQPVARLVDTKRDRSPVKLRQRQGEELGEELPSVAKEDAEQHHQGVPRSSGTAPEDILMAALESLVPTDLEVHLQMNSSRIETYDAMRAEVLAFIESRTGSRMTETKVHKHDKIRDDPMDLDSVVKGKGKNKFSGSCYICGKVGHKATECWSRDRASNKGSGRNPLRDKASPSGKVQKE